MTHLLTDVLPLDLLFASLLILVVDPTGKVMSTMRLVPVREGPTFRHVGDTSSSPPTNETSSIPMTKVSIPHDYKLDKMKSLLIFVCCEL